MTTNRNKRPAAPKRVTVRLARPHRHMGVDHRAGDEIQVTEETVHWMRRHNLIAGEETK